MHKTHGLANPKRSLERTYKTRLIASKFDQGNLNFTRKEYVLFQSISFKIKIIPGLAKDLQFFN
jgi:hypothetical protein